MTGQSVAELIRTPLVDGPDRPLLLDPDGPACSFADYRARVELAADRLVRWGVGPGSTVSWQLPTSLDAIVLTGALAMVGACQNPILPLYGARELGFILGECRPDIFIAEDFGALDALGLGEPRPRLLHAPWSRLAATPTPRAALPAPAPRTDGARWIFYTSGTTANPKGARHTDASIIAGARALARNYAMTPDDRYGLTFPFAHVGGIQMLIAQLCSGAGAILCQRFDPVRSFAMLGEMGVTMIAGGTALAHRALEAQRAAPGVPLFPNLRAVVTGAAPKPPTLHAALRDELGGIGALSCYGMTEAPMGVLSDIGDSDDAKATSEGRPIAGATVRIVDADGREAPADVVGEIRIRGPQVMLGYVDPALTAGAFDADGYLRTGDLGSVDEEGNVRVVGRLKDLIIRNGEKISAAEVEEVLSRHPAIAEVAAIGLPAGAVGERCCAVVRLAAGAAAFGPDELRSFCRTAGLAIYKTPERIEFLEVLPRTASGKVMKADLVARFAARQAAPA